MFAGLAALAYIISFIFYAVSAGSKPFDYIGIFLIGCVLLAVHFYLGWDWRYSWRRTQ
jgi:hypothetical protein